MVLIIINTNNDLYERDCLPEISNITDSNDTRDGEIYEYTKKKERYIKMIMTAQEARDRVEAGRLYKLMDLIESAISLAVFNLEDLAQVTITEEYRNCVTQAMNGLNELGYITLYDYEETDTLTIMW